MLTTFFEVFHKTDLVLHPGLLFAIHSISCFLGLVCFPQFRLTHHCILPLNPCAQQLVCFPLTFPPLTCFSCVCFPPLAHHCILRLPPRAQGDPTRSLFHLLLRLHSHFSDFYPTFLTRDSRFFNIFRFYNLSPVMSNITLF